MSKSKSDCIQQEAQLEVSKAQSRGSSKLEAVELLLLRPAQIPFVEHGFSWVAAGLTLGISCLPSIMIEMQKSAEVEEDTRSTHILSRIELWGAARPTDLYSSTNEIPCECSAPLSWSQTHLHELYLARGCYFDWTPPSGWRSSAISPSHLSLSSLLAVPGLEASHVSMD